ncbi:MAG: CPBP family intramembrane metalloprotease [Clostridia bacterium]|nr:CPBP family intramembrane metalloprotease [Clostridia bacterium]
MSEKPMLTTEQSETPVRARWSAPQITAPLLMTFVLGAMHLSRYFLQRSEEANPFLTISLIQLLVLLLPCMVYYLLKRKSFATPLMLNPIRWRHIPLILLSVPVYIFGMLLLKYFFILISSESITMIGFFDDLSGRTSPDASLAGVLISLAIIPACCEEILFRGVLVSEYGGLGEGNAVVLSSLCFAMLHFSVRDFPAYLYAGLLLGILTVVSRSLLPATILHLVSNLLNLFVSDSFLRITMQKNGKFFVGFVLTVLFGFFLFLFLYMVEYVYIKAAESGKDISLPPKNIRNIPKVFLSPTFLLLVVVFILIATLT